MTAINVAYDLSDGEELIILLDRWGYPSFTITETEGSDNVVFEGTLAQINRGETPVWMPLLVEEGGRGGSGVNELSNSIGLFAGAPLEAIRLTVSGGSGDVAGHVMQSGAR